jgi:hypothetical protein
LIEQHNIQNKEDFRRALLDVEAMKQKVQQWTGHTNTASLEGYINLAFEEVTNFKKTYDAIMLQRRVESACNQISLIRNEMISLSMTEVSLQIEQLLSTLLLELEHCNKYQTMMNTK